MKNVLIGAAALFVIGLTSCSKDKCLNCSYTEPTTMTEVTSDEVCGPATVLDLAEATFQTAAAAAGTTAQCTRN